MISTDQQSRQLSIANYWSKLREGLLYGTIKKQGLTAEVSSINIFDNNIIYTTQLPYEMTNIESFNVVRDAGLKNSNFLHVVWTGLRQSVPLKLHVYEPNFENILDLENLSVAIIIIFL